jgi:acyl transferase domain-containing protein
MASREFIERLKGLGPKQLTLLALELQEKVESLSKQTLEPLAIVGMSCRFPGGVTSPAAYWRLLSEGVDAISEIPADRWDVNALYDPDPDAAGKIATRWGGFLTDLASFDADFFGITPREAANMDPQQRLVLEVAWEALERAGQAPDGLERSRTGVFVGICSTDWFHLNASSDPRGIDAYLASGSSASMTSGRLSYLLGLQGPSMTVDTACSSSSMAIHLASQSLRSGESNMAIAGGVHVILVPEVMMTLSRAHMMAADGRCKAFDSRADGYVRAEGCGLIVLKRLADAQAAGDNVLAVIRGSATNQDGRTSGITAPNGPAQEAVIRDALAAAGLRPADIHYVEAHGTGTSLGDPIEIQALGAALGKGRASNAPLIVGSVKTNMGHLESAAGVAGVMKVVLALQARKIPPHLHFKQPNPHVDWSRLPISIPTRLADWPSRERGRAGVSSFGFSGTNAHIILEEAPPQAPSATPATGATERRPYLLPLAAKSEPALSEMTRLWAEHLRTHTDESLAATCFTAAVGRAHFRHRLAVVGADRNALLEQLDALCAGGAPPRVARGNVAEPPEVAFLFTGQGSQYVGMGRGLYEAEPVFRRVVDECDQALTGLLSRPVKELLFESERAELEQTGNLQPALFTLEVALAALWQSWGVQPSVVIGHSLGEFSAACVAGLFDLAAGARLVAARGRLMQAVRGKGTMVAIMADAASVRALIEPRAREVSLAAVNTPKQTVVSGYSEAVDALTRDLIARGIEVRMLEVSCAFHSPQMDEMLAAFEAEARGVTYRQPKIDIVSNVTGALWGAVELADPAAYWRRHVREPVSFAAGMQALERTGCRVFLEIGPNPVLVGMGRQCVAVEGAHWLPSLKKDRPELEQILETTARLYAAGMRIDWARFYGQQQHRRLELPTYPFQRRRHWRPAPWRSGGSADLHSADRSPTAALLYELDWQPVARNMSAASAAPAVAQKWLILTDRSGLGDALIERLRARGEHCDRVTYEEGVDFARLLGARPTRVVHLWSLDDEIGTALTEQALQAAQRRSCGSLLALVQALAANGTSDPVQLSVVTRGAVTTASDSLKSLAALVAAPVAAMARVVALELPQLQCASIDVDPLHPDVEELDKELANRDRESAVALRAGGSRLVARLIHANAGLTPPAATARAAGESTGDSIEAGATYLITGGLSGLGLEVARNFVTRGARHLVLLGRSAPSERARAVLAAMTDAGVSVRIAAVDVADRPALQSLFDSIAATMPPLRGIVHAAGVLDDGVLLQQSWDRFERVFRPKVAGAWNLHELSQSLPLKFFVLFSSAAALVGSPGQGNYTAANAFLDALAHYRRQRELAGLSIAWGGWGEIGMAASLQSRQHERASRQGISALEPAASLELLQVLLRGSPAHVGVLNIDWSKFLAQYAVGQSPPLLDRLAEPAAAEPAATVLTLSERLRAVPAGDEEAILVAYVRECLGAVLGMRSDEVGVDVPLLQLGLDSLMAIEVRNRIESGGGPVIAMTRYLDGSDVRGIAQAIYESMSFAPPVAAAPLDDNALLDLVPSMSDAEVEALLARLRSEAPS